MAIASIAATLGSGSGIDTKALVASLVDAQFASKTAQLKARDDTLTAQISGVATLKNAIGGFSAALSTLARGGTLTAAPTSSNANAARISAQPGKTVAPLNAQLEVVQLAKPQSAASGLIADRTAAIGTGSFTLTFGTATVADGAMTGFTAGAGTPVTIAIGAGQGSLDGIAAAINAANAGVGASVVGDGGGTRLVLKGATGASQAFTLHSDDAGLGALNVEPGATGTVVGSAAQDALVKLDGIAFARASNTIANLVADARIELTGTGITTFGSSAPTAALGQAVSDFVETYNQLRAILAEQTNAKTGVLRADPAAQTLQRALARLPSAVLSGDADARTLAEAGVATNRDGTLRIDGTRLTRLLATDPAAVGALFTGDGGGGGLAAALGEIAAAAAASGGLGGSETRYSAAKRALGDSQAKALEQAEAMRTRLTGQFATMDARVAAYKATQSFMENQIKVWTRSN